MEGTFMINMNIVYKIIICGTFFLRSILAQGQVQIPETVLKSPNASSFGSFVEMPISYFTGTPNVSVPLYTVKQGDINIPIQLSYNAATIKPDEHPGWVGVNWNLYAGGAIIRKANDMPDEYNVTNPKIKRYYYGYTQFNSLAQLLYTGLTGENAGYYFTHSEFASPPTNMEQVNTLIDADKDARDSQPDEFFFNFLGHSGKFFMDPAGNWQVQSEENFKVIFNNDFLDLPPGLFVSHDKPDLLLAGCYRGWNNLKSFAGFTLVGDDGFQYVFGKTTDAIEYSIPFQTQLIEHWVASSWYLTKVININGEEVNFTYEPDDFISNMGISFVFNYDYPADKDNDPACNFYGNTYGPNAYGEYQDDLVNPRFASYAGDLIRPTYLREIKSKHANVIFNRATSIELGYDQEKTYIKNLNLRDFVRRDGVGEIACRATARNANFLDWVSWPFLIENASKNFTNINDVSRQSLTYAYRLLSALKWKKLTSIEIKRTAVSNSSNLEFVLDYNDNPTERLMLESVTSKTVSGDVKSEGEKYKFEYYNELKYTDYKFPGYLQESTDHYGFPNGNTELMFTALRGIPFNIDLDAYKAKKDAVGYSQISTYGMLQWITYPTGGTVAFNYERHDYSQLLDWYNDKVEWSTNGRSYTGGLRIKQIMLFPVQGAPITTDFFYVKGYHPQLSMNSLPSSGILRGRPIYGLTYFIDYSNKGALKKISSTFISSQNTVPLGPNSSGTHVGYSEVIAKRSDGSYTKYKFTNYTGEDGDHFDERVSPVTDVQGYPASSNDKSLERGKLTFEGKYSSIGTLLKKKEINYAKLSNDYVNSVNITATVFECGDYLAPRSWTYANKIYYYKYLPIKRTETEQRNMKLFDVVTDYEYNSRGQLAKTSTITSREKIQRSEITYSSDPQVSGASQLLQKNILNKVMTQTSYLGEKAVSKLENSYSLIGNNVLLTTSKWRPTGNDKSKDGYFDYNDKALVKQLRTNENVNTVIIWGYDYSFPVAEIKNTTYEKVSEILGSTLIDKLNTNPGSDEEVRSALQVLRSSADLKNVQVKTFTYDPLFGMTSETDYNNFTKYYEYDGFGRLHIVKDHEGNITQTLTYQYKL